MVGLLFTAVGFLLSSINLFISSGRVYPAYQETEELGSLIQQYVVDNLLRGRFNYGVFLNVAGCLLLVVGCALLLKHSTRFVYGMLFALATIALHLAWTMVPFYLNGRQLITSELAFSFFHMVSHVAMGYFIIYGVTRIASKMHNEANVRYVKMGFIGSSICYVVRYFLVILGLPRVATSYQVAILGFTAFYLYNMCRLIDGIPGYTPRKKGRVKGSSHA